MPDMLLKLLLSSCCFELMQLQMGTICHPLLVHRGKICRRLELPGRSQISSYASFCHTLLNCQIIVLLIF